MVNTPTSRTYQAQTFTYFTKVVPTGAEVPVSDDVGVTAAARRVADDARDADLRVDVLDARHTLNLSGRPDSWPG